MNGAGLKVGTLEPYRSYNQDLFCFVFFLFCFRYQKSKSALSCDGPDKKNQGGGGRLVKLKKKNRTGRRRSSSSRRRTATTSKEWTKRGETKKTRMRSRWKASGGGVSGQSASNDSAPARQSGGWSRPATGRGIPRPLVLHRGNNNNNNKNQTKNRKKAQKRTRERERERERDKL